GLRDPVARLAQIVRIARVADCLDRDAQCAKLVLVALEHLLQGVGSAAGFDSLTIPGHAVEDLLFGEPDLRGHQRHDEIRLTLLRGDAGGHHCCVEAGGSMPRMSTTNTSVAFAGTAPLPCSP